jgi:hypothetical protein
MALRKTIDKSLGNDLLVGPDGRCVNQLGRQALADILQHCMDTVLTDYQSLQDNMTLLREDAMPRFFPGSAPEHAAYEPASAQIYLD